MRLCCELQGQASFAHAACASEGQQAHFWSSQASRHRNYFVLAPDECSERCRKSGRMWRLAMFFILNTLLNRTGYLRLAALPAAFCCVRRPRLWRRSGPRGGHAFLLLLVGKVDAQPVVGERR